MRQAKRKKLENKGWKTGSVGEFLNLSDAELAVIDLKLSLARALKEHRRKKHVTQAELATTISSSQSRVAKMEAGDPSVSLDLLVKTILSLGATRRDLANAINRKTGT